MRKMKRTSIPWLPEVADDFAIGYVKQYFYVSKDLSDEGEPERVLKLARSGIVEKDVTTNEGQMASSYEGYNKVHVGDLLLNPMDLYSGANCNVSELNGVISPAYSNLRAKKAGTVVPKYYDYYFKTQYWLMAMFAHGKGVSFDNRWTLNNDALRSYEIPVIPVANQERIVAQIKSEEKKVNALIANVQEQIEKLKAYKQSLITEIVTKGLDPTVPTKDSGVDWIGKMPTHWGCPKISMLADVSSGATPDRSHTEYWNGNINWIKTGELQNNEIYSAEEHITEEGMNNSSVQLYQPDTILVAMYGQGKTRGMTAMLRVASTTNQACAGLVIKNNLITSNYLWKTLIGAYNGLREMAVGSGQPNLNLALIKDFRIPLPPEEEQIAICKYIEAKIPQIEQLIAIKEAKIEKLEQYKKSIIYEYVTGKKEVQ